uniref:ORF382 n=1 Tax=Pyropia endiviifolia TaxID=1699272 RepID=A0A1S5Q764_9RHOD|nr:ORF382 [Pyropia endiviifolia]
MLGKILLGILTGMYKSYLIFYTEREGFEPSLRLLLNSISNAAPSTTRPPLLKNCYTNYYTRKKQKFIAIFATILCQQVNTSY